MFTVQTQGKMKQFSQNEDKKKTAEKKGRTDKNSI